MTAKSYIGLSCTPHDPALAIVDAGGRVVFAEAGERYLQSKRAFNSPPDDMQRIASLLERYCEPGAPIVAAKTWSADYEERLGRGFGEIATLVGGAPARAEGISAAGYVETLLGLHPIFMGSVRQCGVSLEFRLREADPRFGLNLEWRQYDHHLTHAATACFTSPFRRAVCAVLDGMGEGSASAFFTWEDGALREIPASRSLATLGFFYSQLCWACGFDWIRGEEWKVMGLAAYGKRDDVLYEMLRPVFRVDGLQLEFADDFPQRLEALLALRRPAHVPGLASADLAHTGQLVYADVAAELLANLHRETGCDDLVLGGGCALNSSFNGRILERTPFRRLHVPSAPADDGNAIGAALLAWCEDHPGQRPPDCSSPYLGTGMCAETLLRARTLGGLRATVDGKGVVERAAEILARGGIVGWVQGRAEFGPRALGNRSILADPRDPRVKDRLNARVKFREEFRPFAPAILDEHGPEYFEAYQPSRYMERTLRFRAEAGPRVPGVVHADGTGRLQTVRREWNPRFHSLVSAFHRRTGVPLVLNTSFNVMGKPIAHSVEDVLAVFFTAGLDALVIEDCLFEKSHGHEVRA